MQWLTLGLCGANGANKGLPRWTNSVEAQQPVSGANLPSWFLGCFCALTDLCSSRRRSTFLRTRSHFKLSGTMLYAVDLVNILTLVRSCFTFSVIVGTLTFGISTTFSCTIYPLPIAVFIGPCSGWIPLANGIRSSQINITIHWNIPNSKRRVPALSSPPGTARTQQLAPPRRPITQSPGILPFASSSWSLF